MDDGRRYSIQSPISQQSSAHTAHFISAVYTPFMKEYHQRVGDYLERATAYARRGIRHPFQVTRMVMTDEESYTCEYCNRKFETIGAWRRHDGRDPMSGETLFGEAGRALCQRM